ncbi:outer membrane protein assembly factor BamB family protein [Micromonospora echinofusca]|uniref:PQQ-binding-like beta-propeller repeat protein n=1 Tax=Micromonospora echinofusca TaxID=47858 RepID=A0ABS3VUH1_MICEH|nr:PQQ-binding-like beta-propeller repeat protein [Micromonospora echinofusca]MBO4208179.1 PQQ-binding-like beta-propeller repeat protein [Micromonospora echinofusca]
MSLIDLGELRDDPLPDPGPRPVRRGTRLLRVAGVLVLTLLALSAAVPPQPLPEATVPARLGARVHLAGDLLLLADPPDLTGNSDNPPPQLVAYRLPQAHEVWRIALPFPVTGELQGVDRTGDLLVLFGSGGPGPDARSWSIAVGAADGATRWRYPGWAHGFTAAGLPLFWEGDAATGAETLRAVDPRSGQVRWTLPLPSGVTVTMRPQPQGVETLLTVDLTGTFTTYRTDSGARTGTGQLPAPEPSRGYRVVVGVHDLLVATDTGGTVTAYRYPDLQRRWSLQLDGQLSEFHPAPCGRYLCTFHLDGGMQILDPATGRVLAADRRWQFVLAAGDRLLTTSAPDVATSAGPVWVVDPGTGRVVADLGRWRLAMLASIGVHDTDGPVVGIRIDPVSRRMLVAVLDPTESRPRVLGAVRDISGECQTGSGVLVCRRMDGSFGVWPVS